MKIIPIAASVLILAACSGAPDEVAEQNTATTEQAATPVDSFAAAYSNLSGTISWSGESSSATGNVGTIQPGTSPSVAAISGGKYMTAFQDVHTDASGNHYLWIRMSDGTFVNQYLGMDSASSPSIAGLTSGGYIVAFQANNHNLYVTGTLGYAKDQGLGMMPGTSPSIAALPGNSWIAAMQANVGYLWVTAPGAVLPWLAQMAPNTNPSIAAQPDGSWQVAYQGVDNYLYVYDQKQGVVPKGVKMVPNTSPSIAAVPGGGFEIALQWQTSPNNLLYLVGPLANGPTGYGPAPNSSPSIAVGPDRKYEVAFTGLGTNILWFTGSVTSTKGKVLAKTSPSVTALYPAPTLTGTLATNASSATVSLSWNNVGASQYSLMSGCIGNTTNYPANVTSVTLNQNMAASCGYAIVAQYANGFTAFSNTVSFNTPPAVPTGLRASWQDQGTNWAMNVSWNAVSGAQSYSIQQTKLSDSSTSGWKTGLTKTSYQWNWLQPSTTYLYAVVACTGTVCSAPAYVSATVGSSGTSGLINIDLQMSGYDAVSCARSSSGFWVDGASYGTATGSLNGANCDITKVAAPLTLKNHWVCSQWNTLCCKCVTLTSTNYTPTVTLVGSDCRAEHSVAGSSTCK